MLHLRCLTGGSEYASTNPLIRKLRIEPTYLPTCFSVLENAEVHLEHSRTSAMEIFAKIVNFLETVL